MSESNSKRIAKNTLMLYFRQILIMFVSLYTVRVVLNVLGAEDYGIYNVVAGVVTMFGFLSGAMASASQRFFSYEIGVGDKQKLKRTFSVTMLIYVGLTLIIILLAETIGLWFIYRKLIIPQERLYAAKLIYQFSILSFGITMITTPYMSAIIAHECMNIYAYVSVIEVLLRLGIVFILKIIPLDKLIVYGILMFLVTFLNTAIYRIVCKRKFEECKFSLFWDKLMVKEIVGFTGWTIFGAFTSMARTQAITVLVNQFFNPIVVTSRTISMQVSNTLNVFSTNFNTSLYAPIVKEYSADRKETMVSLVFNGCKITFFLMWIFSLPLFLRMDFVLTLWLKEIPEYVVIFTQLSIIEVLIGSISLPITTAARAPGKMKVYELTLGSLQILLFCITYINLKYYNGSPNSIYWIAIIVNIIMFFVRLYIVKGLVGLPLFTFLLKVLIPIIIIICISSVSSFLLNKIIPNTFLGFCAIFLFSVLLSSFLMIFIGMDKIMRESILEKLRMKLRCKK